MNEFKKRASCKDVELFIVKKIAEAGKPIIILNETLHQATGVSHRGISKMKFKTVSIEKIGIHRLYSLKNQVIDYNSISILK